MEHEKELPTSVSSSTVGDDTSFTSTVGDDDKDLSSSDTEGVHTLVLKSLDQSNAALYAKEDIIDSQFIENCGFDEHLNHETSSDNEDTEVMLTPQKQIIMQLLIIHILSIAQMYENPCNQGPEDDHKKQDDKDKSDVDLSDNDIDTSQNNDSITDQDVTVNNDSLWEHSLGVKKEISSSQYNTANDSTIASKDTSFESFNNSSLTINDDLNDSFEDHKNDSFNASKEVEAIGSIEDTVKSDHVTNEFVKEQTNESQIISNTDVEIVGAIEDTSTLNESTSSNQEDVTTPVIDDDQHVDPEITPQKQNFIQEVGTGLISHPMRMEEEVFDGYGEAEEEKEIQDEREENTDTEENEETNIELSNNAQENIAPNDLVIEKKTVDTKEIEKIEIEENDASIEEVTVEQTTQSINSPEHMTPVRPVEISIPATNRHDISITIDDSELVNTDNATKVDIDEHEASEKNEKELEAQASISEASAALNFDENLPGTVEILVSKLTGAKVYLIGTAHFSQESCEDVAKVINRIVE